MDQEAIGPGKPGRRSSEKVTRGAARRSQVSWGSFFENRILPPDFDDARKRTEQREDRLMGRITKR